MSFHSTLVSFKELRVGYPFIEPNKVSSKYTLTLQDGSVVSNTLIYKYDEAVFEPAASESLNIGSIIVAQVAINYGLFCDRIVFDGLYDDADKRFVLDMLENTSREIYVNKILMFNEFLVASHQEPEAEKKKKYTNAIVDFQNSNEAISSAEWNFHPADPDSFLILSSGGKDSLLTYGLIRELGKKAHPVFINESGKHWFTALNSYRYYQQTEPNTARVWCNSDRIFVWVLRYLPFIRPDFEKVKSDNCPIRLWTVAVFLAGTLPIALKRKCAHILIGDEYDSSQRANYEGITHYSGYYDQSRYFDTALARYYTKKGWNINQYSILRPLSELLIQKVLVKRYPKLQKNQISCHAAHEKEGRIYPCGKCEKCRRIVGMLKAIDEDPTQCGYTETHIKKLLQELPEKGVKQIGPDMTHLLFLLQKKGLIELKGTKKAKLHPEIEMLRFDKERSHINEIPTQIRSAINGIVLEYANGAVQMKDRKWEPFDLLAKNQMELPNPFELPDYQSKIEPAQHYHLSDFVWENLSWPEIKQKLKQVDTVILPCGAIEQHGPHLPVDVDFYDARYLAFKVAEACSEPRPLVLPAIPYGVSYHHEDFPGTLSVTNHSLANIIYDIGMNLVKVGIKKIIILNGHGDNAPTLSYAAQMINRDGHIFVCVETGETSDADVDKITSTKNDIHAGEIETSTTLALRPEQVRMEFAENATLEFGSSYLDFSEGGVPWYVRTSKISPTGTIGDPTKASIKTGREIWKIMIAHLVKFVEEIKASQLEDLYQKRY